jgi:hypothetical protein
MMMTALRAFDMPLRSYSGRTVIPMQGKNLEACRDMADCRFAC